MIAYFGAAGYVDESSRNAQNCFCHSVSQHTEDTPPIVFVFSLFCLFVLTEMQHGWGLVSQRYTFSIIHNNNNNNNNKRKYFDEYSPTCFFESLKHTFDEQI